MKNIEPQKEAGNIESERVNPHSTFRPAKLEDIFFMLHNAAEHNMFKGAIFRVYPELKKLLSEVENENERKQIAKEFFSKVLDDNKEEILESTKEFQKAWNKIESNVMQALSEICERDWAEKDKLITVNVSINPISPRDIEKRSFDVYYRKNSKDMYPIAAHEILHFIWFDKFGELFPKIPKKEYDEEENLAWHLSEIVPGVILNDKRLQKIFEHKHTSYQCYYDTEIDGISLMIHIQNLYDSRTGFEDFVRKSWEFVQKHKEQILSSTMSE